MKWRLFLGLLIGIGLAIFAQAGRADAEHGNVRCGGVGEKACILLSSPFVENIIKKQADYTYCLNPRASAYAGFRSQVAKVTAAHAKSLKVSAREVPYPASPADKSCTVRHDMPDNHGCTGCAAWIYVSSYPVVIEYKWQLGFVHWDATVGHELGHGECLLDEHYIKATGQSKILTTGTWMHGRPTVMDTGTYLLAAYAPLGVWDLTEYDLDRCEESIGRDLDTPAPPTIYPYIEGNTWYICDPALPDAQCLWNRYVLGDQWYDKYGNPEWDQKVDIFYPNGGYAGYQQWNRRLVERFFVGQTVWSDKGGGWQCVSFCF